MSNTAEVTPYIEETRPTANDAGETLAAAMAGVVAIGGLAMVATTGLACAGARAAANLLAETDEERASGEQFRQARSIELLKRARPCQQRLRRNDPQALVAAAERLGYRALRSGAASAERTTLARPNGDLLVLSSSCAGIKVTSSVGREAIETVVKQATVYQVERHLQKVGGAATQVRQLRDGSIELRTSEPDGKHPDGRAKITARIDRRGVTHVDIDGIRGNRCESVLEGIADAVGGAVRNKRIKPNYYEAAAAEPARVKARQ